MKELEAAEVADCALLSNTTVGGTSRGRGCSGANIAQSRLPKTSKFDAEGLICGGMIIMTLCCVCSPIYSELLEPILIELIEGSLWLLVAVVVVAVVIVVVVVIIGVGCRRY